MVQIFLAYYGIPLLLRALAIPNVLTLDIGTSSLTQGPNAMSCLVEVQLEGTGQLAFERP